MHLSVDGVLYLCLGDEHKIELRPLLRQGITDDELKPERHEFNEKPNAVIRFMSMTGG